MEEKGRPIGAKLFLEGMEVPFIGATMTSAVGMASIAYIDVVPHFQINNIKPRTRVMLAVRDYHNEDHNFPFVMAWEGEVFGFSFTKTASSRMMTLQCIDYTSYWDNVLTYYFNATTSLGKGMDISSVGYDEQLAKALKIKFQATSTAIDSYFLKIMQETMATKGKDFLDGFVAVLNKIGDVNDFYKAAVNSLKINDRIVLKSSGQLIQLLKQDEALKWFNGALGGESGFATLRQSVMDLMSIIFHDSVTAPFPAGNPHKIFHFIFKPNLFTVPPPMCNVFFPDEYSSFTYNRNFLREPTRLVYKPELPQFMGVGNIKLPHAYAPEAFRKFMEASTGVEKSSSGGDNSSTSSASYGQTVTGPDGGKTIKREPGWMMQEEIFKGILFATENFAPASEGFRQSISDSGKREFAKLIADYLLAKKKYQTRELQITSHLKLSVVPGFNALILDPSDARQNILAYCTSVTHRFYATEGGYTNVSLSYARTVEEQQNSNAGKSGLLIPPWFDQAIFGSGAGTVSVNTPEAKAEIGENNTIAGVDYVRSTQYALTDFYKVLLGNKGSTAVIDITAGEKSLVGSVLHLINLYKNAPDKHSFIRKWTDRDYVLLTSAMSYVGAYTATEDLTQSNFVQFDGGLFSESSSEITKQRRAIIRKYVTALKNQRGFRG